MGVEKTVQQWHNFYHILNPYMLQSLFTRFIPHKDLFDPKSKGNTDTAGSPVHGRYVHCPGLIGACMMLGRFLVDQRTRANIECCTDIKSGIEHLEPVA